MVLQRGKKLRTIIQTMRYIQYKQYIIFMSFFSEKNFYFKYLYLNILDSFL